MDHRVLSLRRISRELQRCPSNSVTRGPTDSASFWHTAAFALVAIDAAAAGARVLIVRNTVGDCVATQVAAEAIARERGLQSLLFRCAGYAAPHHDLYRFLFCDLN